MGSYLDFGETLECPQANSELIQYLLLLKLFVLLGCAVYIGCKWYYEYIETKYCASVAEKLAYFSQYSRTNNSSDTAEVDLTLLVFWIENSVLSDMPEVYSYAVSADDSKLWVRMTENHFKTKQLKVLNRLSKCSNLSIDVIRKSVEFQLVAPKRSCSI
jgi:hypothetical protein